MSAKCYHPSGSWMLRTHETQEGMLQVSCHRSRALESEGLLASEASPFSRFVIVLIRHFFMITPGYAYYFLTNGVSHMLVSLFS
jgi:hypothetical protein